MASFPKRRTCRPSRSGSRESYFSATRFRRGTILLKDQVKILPFAFSFLNPRIKLKKTIKAATAYGAALSVDYQRKRYHWITKRSGLLLSDKCPSLINISLKANEVVSANTITETYPAVGEYVLKLRFRSL